MPWNIGNSRDFSFGPFGGALIPLAVWSIIWTGFALWHAARRGEKWWFIVFLLVHTVGILEIVYLLFVVRILDKHIAKTPSRPSRKK